MSRAVGRLVLAVALLVWRAAPLVAQTVSPHDSVAWADLADRLRGQARARVRLKDGREVEALDPRLDGDSLRFGEQAHAMALAEVLRIQVRRTAAPKGAILGLIVGGAALAIRNRTGSPPTWDHSETLFFGMIGAGVGAVIGGVIGAPLKTWGTVYQAASPGGR